MKVSLLSAAILTGALAWGTGAKAAAVGLDFSDGTVFTTDSFSNVGWSFQVLSEVKVDGLGLFDEGVPGLSGAHQVGLWDAQGNLLRQATVSNASAAKASASGLGRWLFEDIVSVTLGRGSYALGAFYPSNTSDWVVGFAEGLMTVPTLMYLSSLASEGAVFAQPAPYGEVVPGVFGPNLRIVPTSPLPTPVPEPAGLALLGLALAGLAAVRRRSVPALS